MCKSLGFFARRRTAHPNLRIIWRGVRPSFRIYKNGTQRSVSGAVFPASSWSIPMLQIKFLPFGAKLVHPLVNLPPAADDLVIDLNVRRNSLQCSNFAFKVRASKNLRGSCHSRGGRCRGTNGNSSYIFSAEKCTVIITYSKVWKCRLTHELATLAHIIA
jgi:hypothetical protein